MGLLTFLSVIVVLLAGMVFLAAFFFGKEIEATKDRDPASQGYLPIILFYPGLHALIAYRISHFLWKKEMYLLSRGISQIARFFTGIEIHPGAQIGPGLFIDHGMGVVIGETAVVGENVTLFQGVTLGGTGKEIGKRHPTLGDNIVVGAGAKILGNIEIGSHSYVGANAVVLKSMPPNTTVVGVPGHVTKQDGKKIDTAMGHIQVLDPIMHQFEELKKRIEQLEKKKEKKG